MGASRIDRPPTSGGHGRLGRRHGWPSQLAAHSCPRGLRIDDFWIWGPAAVGAGVLQKRPHLQVVLRQPTLPLVPPATGCLCHLNCWLASATRNLAKQGHRPTAECREPLPAYAPYSACSDPSWCDKSYFKLNHFKRGRSHRLGSCWRAISEQNYEPLRMRPAGNAGPPYTFEIHCHVDRRSGTGRPPPPSR